MKNGTWWFGFRYLIFVSITALTVMLASVVQAQQAAHWLLNDVESDEFVFNEWVSLENLSSHKTDSNAFGSSIAFLGQLLLIGDPDSSDTGEVFVYSLANGQPVLDTVLRPSDGQTRDQFGVHIAAKDGVIVVASACGGSQFGGCVYVYTKDENNQYREQRLQGVGAFGSQWDFGRAIAINEQYIAIGAPEAWTVNESSSIEHGKVFLFEADDSAHYSLVQTLIPSNIAKGLKFGSSLAFSDDDLLVGVSGAATYGRLSGDIAHYAKSGNGLYEVRDSTSELESQGFKFYAYGSNIEVNQGYVYSSGVASAQVNRRVDDIAAFRHVDDSSLHLLSTSFVDFVNPTVNVSDSFTVADKQKLIGLSNGESETLPPYFNCWNMGCGQSGYVHEIAHKDGVKIRERRFRLAGEKFYRSSEISSNFSNSSGSLQVNDDGSVFALGVRKIGFINQDGSLIEGEETNTGRVFVYKLGNRLNNHDYLSYAINENTQFAHRLKAHYPDGQSGEVLLEGDDASLFEVTTEGAITFRTLPDYESPSDANGDNIYRLSATVVSADQSSSSTVHLFLEVADIPDSDLDGLEDNIDLDDDNDGVPDLVEKAEGTDSKDIDSYLDSDLDTVPDFFEDGTYGYDKLQPDAIDSDLDGINDYIEAFSGINDAPVWSYVDGNNVNFGVALRQLKAHQTFDEDFDQTGELTKDSGLLYVPAPAHNIVYVYDTTVTPYQKITTIQPSDIAFDDDNDIDFGASIASENGTIVVGAYSDSQNGKSAGAVYIYTDLGDGHYQEQKVVASDGNEADFFGRSVDIDNGVIVVGADNCAIEGIRVGCAYVFTPQSDNSGYSETKLFSRNVSEYAYFGLDVAIDGQTVVVSASGDDSVFEDSGSVFVYQRNTDGTFSEQKLTPNDPEYRGDFGADVDIEDGTLVVGLREDRNQSYIGGSNPGRVYVFNQNSQGDYYQASKLYENLQQTHSRDSSFGQVVKIHNGVIYTGFYQDDNVAEKVKGVYRFHLTDQGIYQQDRLMTTVPENYIRVQNNLVRDFYVDPSSLYMAANYFFVIADNGNSSTVDPYGTITEFELDRFLPDSKQVFINLQEHDTLDNVIEVSDPDGDDMTISLSGRDAEHFQYLSGALQFIHRPLASAPKDYGKDNTYDITLTASDGEWESVASIAVSVLADVDIDNDGIHNNSDLDNDNDGVNDAQDAFPLDPSETTDTDGDGIGNSADPDDDNDGMSDAFEKANGLNPLDPDDALTDLDLDGITNLDESLYGTSPVLVDSDGDGVSDYDELVNRTDPLDPKDLLKRHIKHWVWQDINDDSAAEMVVLVPGDSSQLSVEVREAPDMGVVTRQQFDFNLLWAELHGLGDLNLDGVNEVGVFGYSESERRFKLVALDVVNNLNVVRRFNWPASVVGGKLYSLPDLTGDGTSEVALFGQHKLNKTNQLIVKDGLTAEPVKTFKWVNNWRDVEIMTLVDRNDDNIPEIGLFGTHKRTSKGQLFVLDGVTASKKEVYNWSKTLAEGMPFLPGDLNSDGVSDIGWFARRTDDKRYQLFVKHGDTKAGRAASITWPSALENGKLFSVSDMTFDGVAELGLYGVSGSGENARYKVWINSGADNQRVANLSWPRLWSDISVRQVGDYDNDGIGEIALFGLNTLTAEYEVSVKSPSSRLEIGVIGLGRHIEQLKTEQVDINGDGEKDLVMTWQDSDSGLFKLLVVDANTLALSLVNATIE
ncbi:FG-GAP repeat protein [Vibrio sp. 10N]|uniref:FG-GAP repeat protein n=1 Tax=Vibrio sp. 10N TaxID=3058938 RepID=UPI002812A3FD|nr:hypothetical protein VB10N_29060 [Vibrio sp. 10N]